MPSLELTTNVKVPDAKAFSLELSSFSAETLKKPESYVSSSYTYNETLTFRGTFDPAFILHITSLDNLSPELNEQYSKAFFDFFHKKLGVPDGRGYIAFVDPGRAYLGHKGVTFETIFGNK
jgi:phenylpyruvate tautomerase